MPFIIYRGINCKNKYWLIANSAMMCRLITTCTGCKRKTKNAASKQQVKVVFFYQQKLLWSPAFSDSFPQVADVFLKTEVEY